MLEIRLLNKSYGKKQVLFDLNYTFEDGVYGLLGPNGAGKSTLIQIMTGNLACDSGSVSYCGKDIRKHSREYRKVLGYVPQLQGMYEMFSAFQFLSYMAALKGIQKREIPVQVESVLEVVGLLDVAGKKLSAYSGGMKQRILIAQALLGQPKVLILDEPTAGLDPKERIKIRNFISRIAEKRTVILATHVVSDVDTIAKEILLLGEGRIRRHGSIRELCSQLSGQVHEGRMESVALERLEERAIVSNIQELPDGSIQVRFIAKDGAFRELVAETAEASPNLQEVYLSVFSEQDGGGGENAGTV